MNRRGMCHCEPRRGVAIDPICHCELQRSVAISEIASSFLAEELLAMTKDERRNSSQ